MSTSPISSSRLSRRALVGSSLAAGAVLPLGNVGRVLAAPAAAARPALSLRAAATTGPAGWRTWYLKTPDELRPAAPGSPGQDEIAAVVSAQAEPSDAMKAAIASWNVAPVNVPWSNAIIALNAEFAVPGRIQTRSLALFHAALSDAALAAWDAQVAYARPSPAATDQKIKAPAGVDPAAPTYPSSQATLAGAAAAVLAYLLPTAAAGRFDAMAKEAAMAAVWSGAAFQSDVDAGLTLGKAIGEKAVAYGKADGSDAKWDKSTMPKGPGIWQPTPPKFADPLVPLGGTWKTWVLPSGDAIRPAAPPKYGSDLWKAEMKAVQTTVANRTIDEERLAQWYGVTAPFPPYNPWAHQLIQRAGLDLPHSTRVMAYLNVGYADAGIAVWDAKYTWWTVRPITEDPKLALAFPTPPYPAYPSGYSSLGGVASAVLGTFFPAAAQDLDELAWEAARSRCWAGIHYQIDDEIGMTLGRIVGRLLSLQAQADGAAGAT
jgi:hypothetical protein